MIRTAGIVAILVSSFALVVAYIATAIMPPVEATATAFVVGGYLRHWFVPLYRWVRRRV